MRKNSENLVKSTVLEVERKALELGIMHKPFDKSSRANLDNQFNELFINLLEPVRPSIGTKVTQKRLIEETRFSSTKRSTYSYAVWIRIDTTLPWIELQGRYSTKEEAKLAAKGFVDSIRTAVIRLPAPSSIEKNELIQELWRIRKSSSAFS
ncbi:hypothetical protein MUP77_02195 [Candidatus Bathyarchaeota archaeon]|nr:hypothetical protein [Candidatus Bathyarchaeota archaeon]